jgi:hypothetical protein
MKILSKEDFIKAVESPHFEDIKHLDYIKNLSKGYWVYDELIECLSNRNWIRFAPGFKAGVYLHPQHKFVIKILGMGVGDNPVYFCEKGEYLDHERKMMVKFRNS